MAVSGEDTQDKRAARGSPRPRHVLFLVHYFPPAPPPGPRRALRFARGLAQAGLPVTVVTVAERFYFKIDPSARADAEGPFDLIRTTTLDPIARARARGAPPLDPEEPRPALAASPRPGARGRAVQAAANLVRSVLRPDVDVAWNPLAVRAALAVHARRPIDVVLTTLPPHSTLLAAARVARRTGARLVVDYRDPWAADRAHAWSGPAWARPIDAAIERRALRRVDLAIFTSPTARAYYERAYPFLPRLEVLPNGVDEFVPLRGELPPSPLTWAHAGSIYGGRSLAPVLRAMARVRDRVPMRLVLIGDEPAGDLALAESFGLRDRVEWLGRLSYRATLERLRVAHRLVAMVAGESHPFSIPAKIFDYLATSRPILLLAPLDHAAAEILRRIPEHRAHAPEDEEGIAKLMLEDAATLQQGGLGDVDAERLRPFASSEQVARLARWIEEI